MAGYNNGGRGACARSAGQVAQSATRNLLVLRGDGCIDGCDRQPKALQLGRIDPDAHGAARSKQLGLTDAIQTLDFRHDIAVYIVGDVVTRGLPGCGLKSQNHQEVAHGLVDPHAKGLNHLWQAGQNTSEAVLHVYLSQVRVGAGGKRDGQGTLTTRRCRGLHIHQTLRAVDFALDQLQYGVRHGL